MRISIITVTYNSAEHIQRCFDSIKAQSEKIYEHIIIDGKSSDDTCQIIERYIQQSDGFKKVFISEKDNGVYDAMNKGLALANGDYLWFLNSDDKLAGINIISNVAKIAHLAPTTMIAGGLVIRDETRVLRRYLPKPKGKFYIPQLPHPSLLIQSEFVKKKGIVFDVSKKISSDYKMQLEVIKNGGTLYVCDYIFSEMFTGGISNSKLKYKILGWIESYQAYREVFGFGALVNTLLKVAAKIF